jgi:Tol biopolymer transport system component
LVPGRQEDSLRQPPQGRHRLGYRGDERRRDPKKNLTRNSPAYDALPAFSPNGKWIAFSRDTSDGRSEVWKMRADGTRQVRLTEGFESARYPDWQPRP